MDATEIIPGLWQGGELIPHMPGDFDAVLCLRELEDLALFDPPTAFLWMPILDSPEVPDDDWVDVATNFVDLACLAEWKTLVHCGAGHNRSGFVVAMYLVQKRDMAPQDAIDLIREKRPGALSNQAFVDRILKEGAA